MKTKNILFTIIICLTACNAEIPDFKQKILFEKRYTNWAWSYQNRGFMIDSLGFVRGFDLSKKTVEWNNPDSDGYITKAKMDKNLSYCDSIITQIDPDTLKHYVAKIWGASKGKITKPQMQMADFGEITYSAFIFDNKTNRYKEVMIKIYGDWMRDNNSTEAIDIFQWMNRIGNR